MATLEKRLDKLEEIRLPREELPFVVLHRRWPAAGEPVIWEGEEGEGQPITPAGYDELAQTHTIILVQHRPGPLARKE
jgi:hypothetical protein